MHEDLIRREPITITIAFGGGVVFNTLREGLDFIAREVVNNPVARADFDLMIHENIKRVAKEADADVRP